MGRRALAAAVLALATACASHPRVWVFTAPWDARSNSAVVGDVARGATLITGWIALDTLGGLPEALFPDTLRNTRGERPARFTIVSSYRGDRFHPEAVRRLAADPVARSRAADELMRLVAEGSYGGVVLDLEALTVGDTADLTVVVGALAAAARRGGAKDVSIAVPAYDTAAYPPRLLLPRVDRLLVMLYDQHWAGSEPGPVAARDWAAEQLSTWVAAAGADRVVAALPVYGYHWKPGSPGETVGWDDLQALARKSGREAGRDSASGALRLQLGDSGDVWLSDGPLLAQFSRDVRAQGVRTVALWRLGLEDPAVWRILGVK